MVRLHQLDPLVGACPQHTHIRFRATGTGDWATSRSRHPTASTCGALPPERGTGEAVHGSQPELRVGTDADKLQRIGPALAVQRARGRAADGSRGSPYIGPSSDGRRRGRKRRVGDQQLESGKQRLVQVAAVRTPSRA